MYHKLSSRREERRICEQGKISLIEGSKRLKEKNVRGEEPNERLQRCAYAHEKHTPQEGEPRKPPKAKREENNFGLETHTSW